MTLPRSWSDRIAYALMALATVLYAVTTVQAAIADP